MLVMCTEQRLTSGLPVYEEHVLDHGDQYKGMLVGDVKHGLGVYVFVNGDMYEGEFQNDGMFGHGCYTFASDGRYEGQVCVISGSAWAFCTTTVAPLQACGC
jgi:hypothetical protein